MKASTLGISMILILVPLAGCSGTDPDTDGDNDGVPDSDDDFPNDSNETTDSDGDRAYQLIRPLRLEKHDDSGPWSLHSYLAGLTPQRNVVMLKAAVAALLEPEARILQAYTRSTNQECPPSETPVERLKKAFQEFTDSIESH